MPAAITVPTVDIGPFFSAPFPGEDAFPSAVQTATAAQVDAVFRGDGFLFVRNFGLTEEQVHRMYSLSATLFKQPAHVKETQLAPLQRCTNTGYVGHGVERLNRARPNADMKEALNFRYADDVTPDSTGWPAGLSSATKDYWRVLCAAGDTFAVICAVALGLPHDHFKAMLVHRQSVTFRLLHYPPCDPSGPGIRAGEHTDFGLFTFLFARVPGLQACVVPGGEFHDGTAEARTWAEIPVTDDPAVATVNLGGLMARCTNDQWRATAHRVTAGYAQSVSESRLSIASFFDPDREVLIRVHPNLLPGDTPCKFPPITAGEYITQRLQDAQENVA